MEQRLLWCTQGILDLQGIGIGTAAHHLDPALPKLLAELQVFKEVRLLRVCFAAVC